MKAQDFALMMGVLIFIVASMGLFGKCNCNQPTAQLQPAPAQVADPLLQVLKEQRRLDSLTILTLNEQLKQLQPKKETAGKKAAAAISKGNTAIQKNNCDSLTTAFQDLSKQHTEYQEYAEKDMEIKGTIISTQERIIVTQRSELVIKETQLSNIASNYSGLQQLYEKQSKELSKSERKQKRAKRLNRLSVPVAIAGIAFFILSVK